MKVSIEQIESELHKAFIEERTWLKTAIAIHDLFYENGSVAVLPESTLTNLVFRHNKSLIQHINMLEIENQVLNNKLDKAKSRIAEYQSEYEKMQASRAVVKSEIAKNGNYKQELETLKSKHSNLIYAYDQLQRKKMEDFDKANDKYYKLKYNYALAFLDIKELRSQFNEYLNSARKGYFKNIEIEQP